LENINNWIAKLEDPDFPKNLAHWDRERLTYEAPTIIQEELTKNKAEIVGKLKRVEMGNDNENRCTWYFCDFPDLEKEAEKLIDKVVNSYFLKEYVLKKLGPAKKDAGKLFANTQTGKKLSPVQRHKIECRRIAAELWNKDPSITIADMVHKDEINLVSDPKNYNGKTLRNWIKDLCPDRTPGRRPKKS
jgi:hypothetical protein